jgi:hypothetical protein
MKPLPKEIELSAFVSDDGEFAWQRQHIFVALRAIADTGQAILGGDVWAVEDSKICSLFPESKGVRMWDTQPYKPNESWFEYCRRTCNESVREIEKTKLENNVSAELQQYIFYNPVYIEQNEVKGFIPRDKHDIERAEAAVKAGYPAIAPILPNLMEWLQDMNWPVAGVLAPFLASIGAPLIPHIRKIFTTDDKIWKRWIISQILDESREVAEAFRDELERIAYSPTEQEVLEELNEVAQFTLKEYSWIKSNS